MMAHHLHLNLGERLERRVDSGVDFQTHPGDDLGHHRILQQEREGATPPTTSLLHRNPLLS